MGGLCSKNKTSSTSVSLKEKGGAAVDLAQLTAEPLQTKQPALMKNDSQNPPLKKKITMNETDLKR